MKKISISIVVALFLATLVIGFIGFNFINSSTGNQSEQSVFKVEDGDSFNRITKNLYSEDFITDKTYFKILGRLQSMTSSLKVGEYSLNKSMTPPQILEVLSSGKSIQYKVTIPEGTNIYEMADILSSKNFVNRERFLQLCKDKNFVSKHLGPGFDSLEGYLFPETYAFTRSATEEKILEIMLRSFSEVFKTVDTGIMKMSPREQVILASMIEKETGAPEERRLISSVFHNRLKKKMRLQSDPTIIYGMADETGIIPTNIRKKDILRKTKYNTYKIPALPYGPITNPGKEALHAALNPVESKYLFFVSQNDGTHVFTTNLKDHQNAVRKYQLNRKAREGKSWRNRRKEQ